MASQNQGSSSTNFFKNFEKQTSDAWEFDEDDEDLEQDVDYSFPISIPVNTETLFSYSVDGWG